MATTITLKNSTVLDKVPTSLEIGELAINANSGSPAAYIEDSSGAIIQLAGPGSEPDATETVKGIAQIATTAQVTTGTDDTTIVTPAKLAAEIPAAQDLQSVCDEGTVTTTGATFGNGSTVIGSNGAISSSGDLTIDIDTLVVDVSTGYITIGPYVSGSAGSNGVQLRDSGEVWINKNGGDAITIYNNSATETLTVSAAGEITATTYNLSSLPTLP